MIKPTNSISTKKHAFWDAACIPTLLNMTDEQKFEFLTIFAKILNIKKFQSNPHYPGWLSSHEVCLEAFDPNTDTDEKIQLLNKIPYLMKEGHATDIIWVISKRMQTPIKFTDRLERFFNNYPTSLFKIVAMFMDQLLLYYEKEGEK